MSEEPSPKQSPPLPRTAWDWLRVFGPGAVIASCTIGSGELIFSTRGGALFGYRILFLFVVISVLKWGLVIAAARHFILTGVHPYRRMLDLPGPRGWLPLVLFLIACVCLPIWTSFFPGVLGNLISTVTGTGEWLCGGIDYLWGAIILAAVLTLAATTGYSVLERVQYTIVATMILCAGISLLLQNPEWLELLKGAFVPQVLEYPDWLVGTDGPYSNIAEESVWVETTRYVGVIGGAGYDYMAYTSWLREKRWGRAGAEPASHDELIRTADDPSHLARRWTRAPYVDCGVSFMLVIAFSAVFVASGAMLGGEHKIPDESNMLELQSQFMTTIHSALYPLYIVGAFLTIFGTLYGTLEIGCAISSEMAHAVSRDFAMRHAKRIRLVTIAWCGVGAYAILAWLTYYQVSGGEGKPRMLLAILTPANLFTGVLGCGIFCLTNWWIDRRFLPPGLRMPRWLLALNIFSGAVFLFLGFKGYWDHRSRFFAIGSLVALLAIGVLGAWIAERAASKRAAP